MGQSDHAVGPMSNSPVIMEARKSAQDPGPPTRKGEGLTYQGGETSEIHFPFGRDCKNGEIETRMEGDL